MDTKDRKRQAVAPPRGGRKPASAQTADRKTAQPARRRKPAEAGIVYTQPKPFNRNRFLLRLATVVAVVLAMLLGMAIFFKVETVTVSGVEKYTAWDIKQASGIQEGDSLLSLSDAKISGKIITALPYVKQARAGIKLPNTVNIEIEELDVVYAVECNDSSWWLMSADGRVVDSTNSAEAKAYARIVGVQLSNPQVGQQAVAAEPDPAAESDPEASSQPVQTTPVTVHNSERLDTVVTILQYLEENGIIGQMASVDVSNLGAIEMWYGTRFQINLGDRTQLGYKVSSMKSTIDNPEMGQYSSGMLDVSFTVKPDMVVYTPFANVE